MSEATVAPISIEEVLSIMGEILSLLAPPCPWSGRSWGALVVKVSQQRDPANLFRMLPVFWPRVAALRPNQLACQFVKSLIQGPAVLTNAEQDANRMQTIGNG